MDPATQGALAATTAAITAATTVMSANAQSQAADIQGQMAERQALEERAVAQRAAGEELRKKQFVQSRLMTASGASGSGASDPTVIGLMEGIEREGQYNAASVQAAGDRRAASTTYQAALDRWSADSSSRIARIGAAGTLIGGFGSAFARYRSPMAQRYGSRGTSGGTGYGG